MVVGERRRHKDESADEPGNNARRVHGHGNGQRRFAFDGASEVYADCEFTRGRRIRANPHAHG